MQRRSLSRTNALPPGDPALAVDPTQPPLSCQISFSTRSYKSAMSKLGRTQVFFLGGGGDPQQKNMLERPPPLGDQISNSLQHNNHTTLRTEHPSFPRVFQLNPHSRHSKTRKQQHSKSHSNSPLFDARGRVEQNRLRSLHVHHALRPQVQL